LAPPRRWRSSPPKIGQWGSLYLDDLSPILAKSAQLKQEVTARLDALLGVALRHEGGTKVLERLATGNVIESTPISAKAH